LGGIRPQKRGSVWRAKLDSGLPDGGPQGKTTRGPSMASCVCGMGLIAVVGYVRKGGVHEGIESELAQEDGEQCASLAASRTRRGEPHEKSPQLWVK